MDNLSVVKLSKKKTEKKHVDDKKTYQINNVAIGKKI